MAKLQFEWRHSCKYCGSQWCKCHHNIRYRYLPYTPDNYLKKVREED